MISDYSPTFGNRPGDVDYASPFRFVGREVPIEDLRERAIDKAWYQVLAHQRSLETPPDLVAAIVEVTLRAVRDWQSGPGDHWDSPLNAATTGVRDG